METMHFKCTPLLCCILICWLNRVSTNNEFSSECKRQLEVYANKSLNEFLNKSISERWEQMAAHYNKTVLDNETKRLKSKFNTTIETKRKNIIDENRRKADFVLKNDTEHSMHYKDSIVNFTDSEIKKIEKDAMLLTESIERNLTSKANNISKARYSDTETKVSPVAFTALLTHNNNLTNEYVVFDKEITNIGLGYNKSSGIFTAPIKGIYFFSSCFLVKKGYANVQLLRNDIEVSRGYGAEEDLEGNGLIHIMLELDHGDYLGLKMIPDWVTGFIRGDRYSSFAGFLVKG